MIAFEISRLIKWTLYNEIMTPSFVNVILIDLRTIKNSFRWNNLST